MYGSGQIQASEFPGHLIDHPPAAGLIATGPDQNGRMVFIPLITGMHPVQHHGQPFHTVTGQGGTQICLSAVHRHPGPVCLHIVFCHHIQTICVTQMIQRCVIGIMTRSNGIYIVLLHCHHIQKGFFLCNRPAMTAGKIMPVDPLQLYPPAI